MAFDAVIIAGAADARASVLGLSLVERGVKTATIAGARRVTVVEAGAPLPPRDGDRLVIDVRGALVHPPLVTGLINPDGETRVAVDPSGAYAGAIFTRGDELDPPDAVRVVHGDIARHAASTPAERRGAAQMLLRLIVKSEDSPVSKYIYRPISRPMSRLLVHTPITPNQVSIVVGIIGMIGCWLTARPGHANLAWGAALVLAAGFLDGCDGEIARLKMQYSKIGAWLDTIIDELTSTVYFVACGLHVRAEHPDLPWVVPLIVAGTICYVLAIYGIYYFLIVVSKTGNSQHYTGDLEVVGDRGLRKRVREASKLPPWVGKVGGLFMLVVRRDFINLGALAMALANAYWLLAALMLAGGIITASIVTFEHVKLRGLLRELRRRGGTPRLL